MRSWPLLLSACLTECGYQPFPVLAWSGMCTTGSPGLGAFGLVLELHHQLSSSSHNADCGTLQPSSLHELIPHSFHTNVYTYFNRMYVYELYVHVYIYMHTHLLLVLFLWRTFIIGAQFQAPVAFYQQEIGCFSSIGTPSFSLSPKSRKHSEHSCCYWGTVMPHLWERRSLKLHPVTFSWSVSMYGVQKGKLDITDSCGNHYQYANVRRFSNIWIWYLFLCLAF